MRKFPLIEEVSLASNVQAKLLIQTQSVVEFLDISRWCNVQSSRHNDNLSSVVCFICISLDKFK